MVIDIVGDAIRDILSKLESSQVKLALPDFAMTVHMESIKYLTSEERDTRGNYYRRLSDNEPYEYASWKRQYTDEGDLANLRAGKYYPGAGWQTFGGDSPSKPKALETMYNQVFDNESLLNFYNIDANEYMGRHQEGENRPRRKWFPTEEDMQTSVQVENIDRISEYLRQVLDKGLIVRSVNG
jgi:hypothetical protein